MLWLILGGVVLVVAVLVGGLVLFCYVLADGGDVRDLGEWS